VNLVFCFACEIGVKCAIVLGGSQDSYLSEGLWLLSSTFILSSIFSFPLSFQAACLHKGKRASTRENLEEDLLQ